MDFKPSTKKLVIIAAMMIGFILIYILTNLLLSLV